MLSGVLRSDRATAVNIEIMRVFVELCRAAVGHAALEKRLSELERGLGRHDEQLGEIFKTLRQLISPPVRLKSVGRLKTTASHIGAFSSIPLESANGMETRNMAVNHSRHTVTTSRLPANGIGASALPNIGTITWQV